jgi:hypothetical protein
MEKRAGSMVGGAPRKKNVKKAWTHCHAFSTERTRPKQKE